jgi:diguanylate cyclase (GGDEF)-like protein/PAS domain S-box-containing protein
VQSVDVALGEPGGSEKAADAFDRVFSTSPIGMAVISDGIVRRVNHRMSDLMGEDRTGVHLDSMIGPEDLAMVREQLGRMVARELQAVTLSVNLRRADGHELPVSFAVAVLRDDAGEPRQYLVQVQDRSVTQQLEAEIRHATDHDSLTGLLNRSALLPLLRELPGAPAALAVLDIDGLAHINEMYGTSAGDAVLEAVATRLGGAIQEGAALARIGGDEFGVLLADVDAPAARRVVDDLLEAISSRPIELAGARIGVSACAGLAVSDDLLAQAGEALAQAKVNGPGSVVLFDSGMHRRRDSGRTWADKVRRGLQMGTMLLDAQPIVDAVTGEPTLYELLLRLRDDDGTIVRPNTFLGAVRQHGLMPAVDEWVVHQAIRLAETREREGMPIDLSINLSAESLSDKTFLGAVVQRLVDAPEAGKHIIFELTERAALADRAVVQRLMARLGEFGCRFALDDFGAGAASLANLKRLPVDFVKLDGQLTRDLPSDASDHAIAEAVVQAAHVLGLTVVAECVEDEEILEAVRGLGVDLAQGVHVGRPQPMRTLLRVTA